MTRITLHINLELFDGTAMQAIARAAGVGKATLYKNFSGKLELFVACLERLRFTLVPPSTRAAAAAGLPLADEVHLPTPSSRASPPTAQ